MAAQPEGRIVVGLAAEGAAKYLDLLCNCVVICRAQQQSPRAPSPLLSSAGPLTEEYVRRNPVAAALLYPRYATCA